MSKSDRFIRIRQIKPWRKLSIALWPQGAYRPFRVSLDLTRASEVKQTVGSTWTQILSYALVQTIKTLPEKHLFIHGYKLKTRSNIDLFIKMSVMDQNNDDTLWSMYLRGLQELSFSEFSKKFNALQMKYQKFENRMGSIDKLIQRTPILLLIPIIKVLDQLLRLGIPIPVVHNYAYPSISVTNLGSVKTPETDPLSTPLTYPIMNIAIGEIKDNKVNITIMADHRVLDGKDVGTFIKRLQESLNRPEQEFQ